ncbi:hypothetical protein [Streptomyces sp. MZ04]|uniref:hypothetical protein n=1 Tax=Streptomyces sp. MZ04 TaxID=2559236 RepID=UPI00107EDB70|nr:hypothetical protein [Streptomyces sp. MZ04]TGB10803.1 hypothetical protein E2651_14145 [Streptomyces sp. MZ04]
MRATIKHALYSTTTAAALIVGSLAITPGVATAAENGAQQCDVFNFYKVNPYGKSSFKSRGSTVSKYNSSSGASWLTLSVKTNKSRSTTWVGEGGGSIKWGIGKIEAKTSYSVEKKVSAGATVTNRMKVDAKKRGFTKPGVLYRKFVIRKYRQNGNCGSTLLDSWHMKAIVSKLHFAECQTKRPSCKPKA